MKRTLLSEFGLRQPWIVIVLVLALTGVLGFQFRNVTFDNDPENMLAKDEYVRVFHHQVKERFSLYDFVVVGIVNEQHADGVFNTGTLGRIHALTHQLLRLHRGDDGLPTVINTMPDGREVPRSIDLTPAGGWRRALNVAFRHDPNRLFAEDGHSAIIGEELISPSVVDSIRQADLGSLKIEYLMETAPVTRADALAIRDNAMGNPLYEGTLVSEDEKAICLYIPIEEKTYSYNVAALVRELTASWPEEDRVFITGLPVAEDTFGVEMLVQMATSAPLAGLAIFILLLVFFRRLSLIIAPMIVAVVSVVCTMGLLITLGFDVHIMSSMIAIFLMPIAVADSVHILSEFFDVFHRFGDKKATMRHVVGHLFMPMLYTTLTTIAGFASLGLTPIPPVRVFGLHVAFGVGLAWLLTMTLVPAYIMVAVPMSTLRRLGNTGKDGQKGEQLRSSSLARGLESLSGFTTRRWHVILGVTLVIVVLSAYGISRIQVNDNPVKWFTPNHPIRVADEVLNEHFGGTYTAYLTLSAARPESASCHEKAATLVAAAEARFGQALPDATREFVSAINDMKQLYGNVNSSDIKACLVKLAQRVETIDAKAMASWNTLADEINYLDPEGLDYNALLDAIDKVADVADADKRVLVSRLQSMQSLIGEDLLDAALSVCDEFTSLSLKEFLFDMEAELTAPLFKQPAMLEYLEALQRHLKTIPVVGKTSSAVDALKKAGYELLYVAPPADATETERAEYAARNRGHYSVPDSAAAVGQVFIQLEGMKKKDALFHLVTKDYQHANLWVQLKSGDNRDMETVVASVRGYMKANPPPVDLNIGWAGLTYLNVVWQEKMVRGMLSSLGSSFVVVLVMMMVLFRSPLFGILSMLPLSVTIASIYGLIGIVGKDYDMPVAVLSALTLGLSVDFAIHFLERARELHKQKGSWREASRDVFKEPAMAISRNAITISIGFTPLLVAPLVPYKTVGFFLASIMAVSWAATLLLLPALITLLERVLFKEKTD